MLTLADPLLTGGIETETESRDTTLLQGLRVGRLPHAREESRAIDRYVGGAEALVGESASEKALKSRDLGAYDILHFAAHAVADEAHRRTVGLPNGRSPGVVPPVPVTHHEGHWTCETF
jgi:hypothetical protein